jgi:serine O-acetyltransferase
MTTEPKKESKLWKDLQEVYDTYEVHSFSERPPDRPVGDHFKGESERLAKVLFGMPTLSVGLYVLRDDLLRREWPLLPYVCELLARAMWHVAIGRRVTFGRRLLIPHGHAVIDGKVSLGDDVIINPWVTIGLSGSRRWGFDARGPIIGNKVYIGTGAKVLGPITIGDGARIGANAVVVDDVPAGATVVGAPARVVHDAPAQWPAKREEGSAP